MSDGAEVAERPAKKGIRFPLVLGLVLAVLGGGGGFLAARSGLLALGEGGRPAAHGGEHAGGTPEADGLADVAFLPVERLVVSVGKGSAARHLQFRAELEVDPAHRDEIERLLPRVVDVFNTYLRALTPADLEESAALVRLRAQLLRRIQIVTGTDRVNDLLIMEFVLN